MTKQQAIKKSIAHWIRMIAWVSLQPKKDEVDYYLMKQQIGEWWGSKDCSLCQLFIVGECIECPFKIRYGRCADNLENAWYKVDVSQTWGEWLIHAKVMLKQLRSLR